MMSGVRCALCIDAHEGHSRDTNCCMRNTVRDVGLQIPILPFSHVLFLDSGVLTPEDSCQHQRAFF